jgi:hypothetical protein
MTETADDKDDVPGTPESARHERGIGELSERSLHAALKQHLAQPGDQFEVKLGRYVIDLVRDDLLIEIQTRHLYALRPKLRRLLDDGRRIHLVHPLPAERWIVREDAAGRPVSRRKSPRHAAVHDIFTELVRLPDLAAHPNLTLEVLLIQEEQVWRDDGQGSWRRGRWSLVDRRLVGVRGAAVFGAPADYPRFAAVAAGTVHQRRPGPDRRLEQPSGGQGDLLAPADGAARIPRQTGAAQSVPAETAGGRRG